MNIFVLDENPQEAARLACDKHVVKMILETRKILEDDAIQVNPLVKLAPVLGRYDAAGVIGDFGDHCNLVTFPS